MSTYAYIRVSTEMQCYSSQEHEIRRYCRIHKIVIDEWVSESISGTIEIEKRVLGKVIENMSEGDLLVCTELSRLGRNMLMIMGILNICAKKGISIQTIKDNFMLSDSINSKIIAFAFALAAEIERNLISQRTKEALAVKRLEGVKLGRPPGSSRQRLTFYKEYHNIHRMIEEGRTMVYIARKYGFHRNTLHRYLAEFEKMKENLNF